MPLGNSPDPSHRNASRVARQPWNSVFCGTGEVCYGEGGKCTHSSSGCWACLSAEARDAPCFQNHGQFQKFFILIRQGKPSISHSGRTAWAPLMWQQTMLGTKTTEVSKKDTSLSLDFQPARETQKMNEENYEGESTEAEKGRGC